MKILILASPRSGSTILNRALSKILKLFPYGEPFNYGLQRQNFKYPFELRKKSVVKSLVFQVPEGYDNSKGDFYDFYKDNFDRVILLTRKDIQKTYESYSYNTYHYPNGNWPFKYWYEEVPFSYKLYNSVVRNHNKILDYGLKWNVPVTYYEDLYSGIKPQVLKCINSWDLDISFNDLFFYTTPANKYRKEGKQDNFI